MTTRTTSLGTNSAVINYSINATQAELMTALKAVLATRGWESIHDPSTTITILRALMADGVNYKYVRLTIGTADITIEPFELWNNDTKAVSGLGIIAPAVERQRLSLAFGGYLYVFATARYMLMYSRINTADLGGATGNSWDGVLEISKDNAAEVAGAYPLFAWTGGHRAVGRLAASSNTNCFNLPRAFGKTAYADTDSQQPNSVGTVFGSSSSSTVMLYSQLPIAPNPIDANATSFVMTPYALATVGYANVAAHVRGRFFGLKVLTRNLGAPLDKIVIKTDVSLFFDPNGTDADHFILGAADGVRFAIPA